MTPAHSYPTPAEAEALVRGQVGSLPLELRPLESLAGSVLAQSVRAERDQPPFDRVTMDGVAFSCAAWREGRRRFRISGVQAAGTPPLQLADPEHCLEVMTGAILPRGCDCVVPIERLDIADGWAQVEDKVPVEPYLNVHTRGVDCREGDMLLASGVRLGAPELAVLASAGLPRAQVHAEPRMLIIATGDELVAPGEPIQDWQVRRSNTYALRAALTLRGFTRIAEDHLSDDPVLLKERIATHLATHDVLVLTGGVSMGRFDHVPKTMLDLGVREVFHKIAQRPGQAAVVRHRSAGTGRVRFAGQSRVRPRLPGSLRRAGAVRDDGREAGPGRNGSPRRAVPRQAASVVLPAGPGRAQRAAGTGCHAAADARLRRLRVIARHRRLRRAAARPGRIPARPPRPALPLVNA